MSSDTAAGVPAAYAFEQLESSQVVGGTAAELIEGAWAQAEQIRETARETGYAEGRAAGFAQARTEVESAIAALATALGAFAALREELTTALEHDAADLAFKLSEQVLAGALDVAAGARDRRRAQRPSPRHRSSPGSPARQPGRS